MLFGVGLMATAGYLISRAAEQPAILSLTVAIVAVRFFGLARPIARYFERLASHDLAFRVARARARARLPAHRAARASPARGPTATATSSRAWSADVDALQNLHLRGARASARGSRGRRRLRSGHGAVPPAAPRSCSPSGCCRRRRRARALVSGTRGRAGRRQARRCGATSPPSSWTSSAARPSSRSTAEQDALLARARGATLELVRLGRRAAFADGLGDGLGLVVTGADRGRRARDGGGRPRGRLARPHARLRCSRCSRSPSFEAVQPLAGAARELSATLAAGRRCSISTTASPLCAIRRAGAAPPAPFGITLEDVGARYAPGEPPVLDGASLRLDPGSRIALVGPSGAGKTTVANLLLRFLDPERGRVTLAGRDLREYRQEDVRRAIAVAGQDSHLFSTSIRENVLLARPAATDAEIEAASWAGAAVGLGDRRFPTAWTRWSGRRAGSCPAASASASASRGRCSPTLPSSFSTSRPHTSTSRRRRARARRPRRCRRPIRAAHHAPPRGLDLVDEVLVLG